MDIVLIAALSLDGRLTAPGQHGSDWTSAEDRTLLRELLAPCDSSVMGAGTYRPYRNQILHGSPNRKRLIWTRTPLAFVNDARPGSLEFTDASPQGIVDSLRNEGRQRCALLGGTETYSAFLEADLVSEIWITIEPVLFGSGLPLWQGTRSSRWEWRETRPLSASTFAHHYRKQA